MADFSGVASLLDQPASKRVARLWRELEAGCGLVGVRVTPFPHFSWQVSEGYNLPRLEQALKEIAHQARPFTVRTAGLGIFSGENPIIYIPLIKDETLSRFHLNLWEVTQEIAINPALLYAPNQWMPHITLAYGDVDRENLGCAMHALAFQSFEWEIRIDNIVFVAQTGDQVARPHTYPLGG